MKRFLYFFKNHWFFSLLLLCLFFVFFSTLGKTALWDWDECLYAGYANSMKLSQNFLTSYWNGQVILDKLPLYAIFLQIPMLFSDSEYSLRIVNVAFTILLFSCVYWFSFKRFNKRTAIISVLLLLTCEVLVRYFARISTDIPYSLFVFLGFTTFVSQIEAKKRAFFSGVLFGIAVLIKGFAVLPFLTAMAITAIIYERKKCVKIIILMLLGFIVTCLPWIVVEYILYGQKFITVYFLENIIQRAKYPIEFHFGGRLFYVNIIVRELFPWIVAGFVWILFVFNSIQKTGLKNLKSIIEDNRKVIELLLCVVLPFVSITLSKTKLEWYVAPLYPFLVIYIGQCFDTLFKRFKFPSIVILVVILLIFVDGFKLITRETRFFSKSDKLSPRDAIAIEARKQPHKTLDYLVQFSERQGRNSLNPTLYTSFTWIYGGNSCAHFHSQKKVKYYYSTSDFLKRIEKGAGLFLLENGDFHFVENLPIKIIMRNSDFTLFRHDALK